MYLEIGMDDFDVVNANVWLQTEWVINISYRLKLIIKMHHFVSLLPITLVAVQQCYTNPIRSENSAII